MYKILLILIAGIVLNGCYKTEEKQFKNQKRYKISIGQKIEIYYSGNTCCHSCIINKNLFKHIALVDNKLVEDAPKKCIGCNHTAAFVFKGTSPGIDTVKLNNVTATEDCNKISNNMHLEEYIIEIE